MKVGRWPDLKTQKGDIPWPCPPLQKGTTGGLVFINDLPYKSIIVCIVSEIVK